MEFNQCLGRKKRLAKWAEGGVLCFYFVCICAGLCKDCLAVVDTKNGKTGGSTLIESTTRGKRSSIGGLCDDIAKTFTLD